MLHKHCHLLGRNKGLEVIPRLVVIAGLDLGDGTMPDDATGNGKEIIHQLALAGDLHLNRTFTQTGGTVLVAVVAVDDIDGIVKAEDLNIGIVRLARDSLHDDVDWLQIVVENLGVLAKDGDDLGTCRGVRDLCLKHQYRSTLQDCERAGSKEVLRF